MDIAEYFEHLKKMCDLAGDKYIHGEVYTSDDGYEISVSVKKVNNKLNQEKDEE